MGNYQFSTIEYVIAGVVIFILATFLLFHLCRDFWISVFAEERILRARLTSKHQERVQSKPVFRSGDNRGIKEGLTETSVIYVLDFVAQEGGVQYSFEVEKYVYDNLAEGMNDMLCFKGKKLLSFGYMKADLPAGRRNITLQNVQDRQI